MPINNEWLTQGVTKLFSEREDGFRLDLLCKQQDKFITSNAPNSVHSPNTILKPLSDL